MLAMLAMLECLRVFDHVGVPDHHHGQLIWILERSRSRAEAVRQGV